ncbi:hypothetical protein CKY28_05065 [Sphingomonas lenta]|uniref:Prevent-host-death protein n=2 Tax=Sphingomonas lenta TaxID=1141887 RepID=A0A2A2SHP0_9SPHN|nr:hypothetical protein CKY28_05065 [Sphingomonas lenta]
MKMGIKEFRERLGEVARGGEPVQLTDRGRVIGTYTPLPRMSDEQRRRSLEALEDLRRVQEDLRAAGVDTEKWLAEMGLDPWGVPLPAHDR